MVGEIEKKMIGTDINLTDIIYQYENATFSWENFDCCTFSMSVIEEFIGKELINWKKEILDYKSAKESLKFLKKAGCKSLREAPEKILGVKEKSISEVKLGDLVYYINEDDQGIMGVCNGMRAYFLSWDGGLTARNIKDCECCWSLN